MNYNTKNNSFISYGCILITLFVLILGTKSQIYAVQENLDRGNTLETTISDKRNELTQLNAGKETLKKEGINVEKYLKKIDEAEIIEYFYNYMERVNDSDSIASVKQIQFSEGKLNDLGFLESKIDVTLRLGGVDKLKLILKELTGENAQYKFYIDSLAFPYGKKGPFTITIPLKIFYK